MRPTYAAKARSVVSIWVVAAITYALGFGAGLLQAGSAGAWLVGAALLGAPALGYAHSTHRYRTRWGEALAPIEVAIAGAYRALPVVPGYDHRIPWRVRLASASCYAFGIQFVPGLALGIIGLIAAGLGILSLPGLYVAHELWRAGGWLLERTHESLEKAARAARAAQMLNVVLVSLFAMGFIVALFSGEHGLMLLAGALFCMAAAALAQALWLARVIATIEPRSAFG